jgi:hypothetical protein
MGKKSKPIKRGSDNKRMPIGRDEWREYFRESDRKGRRKDYMDEERQEQQIRNQMPEYAKVNYSHVGVSSSREAKRKNKSVKAIAIGVFESNRKKH